MVSPWYLKGLENSMYCARSLLIVSGATIMSACPLSSSPIIPFHSFLLLLFTCRGKPSGVWSIWSAGKFTLKFVVIFQLQFNLLPFVFCSVGTGSIGVKPGWMNLLQLSVLRPPEPSMKSRWTGLKWMLGAWISAFAWSTEWHLLLSGFQDPSCFCSDYWSL